MVNTLAWNREFILEENQLTALNQQPQYLHVSDVHNMDFARS